MSELNGRIDNLPEAQYHAATDFLGSSTLAQMRKSPLHLKTAWEIPLEPTDPMERGTFIHRVALEQDISDYAKRPVNADGTLVRSNSKEYKEWAEANKTKRFCKPDLYDDAPMILDAICSHDPFMRLYNAGKTEVSFFGRDPNTGQKIKARCDLVADDYSWICDVKSCGQMDTFERDIFKMGYDVRLVHYARTIQAAVPFIEVRMPDFYFLAIESAKPFGVKLFKLSDADARDAADLHAQWMNVVKTCREDNVWPGYSQDIITPRRPAYLQRDDQPTFEE